MAYHLSLSAKLPNPLYFLVVKPMAKHFNSSRIDDGLSLSLSLSIYIYIFGPKDDLKVIVQGSVKEMMVHGCFGIAIVSRLTVNV